VSDNHGKRICFSSIDRYVGRHSLFRGIRVAKKRKVLLRNMTHQEKKVYTDPQIGILAILKRNLLKTFEKHLRKSIRRH